MSWIAAAMVALVASALLSCSASESSADDAALVSKVTYGDDPANYGMLHVPAGLGPFPVVVMVHGGGWIQEHDLSYFEPLSQALAAEGVAVWNIEYRRVGGAGGWPVTLADADDATDALTGVVQVAANGRLDLGRVVVAGHSAGGHLAAWIVGRHTLPADAPGGQPTVLAKSAVVMAGVFDPALAVLNGHDKFVRDLIGGPPSEYPARYAVAAPIAHLPIGTKVIAMHGTADTTVDPVQSSSYVQAAQEFGDPAELVLIDGAGHGDFGNVDSDAWREAKRVILNEAWG
ncbi:alpha/beta hydrolase family protein [Tomitella biformata]|uniref:alpha/beta hydrolase family protein n=1 Tax=Tomitella biformata TaxID=630403 RepID=UPI00046537FE|nr:alpha/beta fold hydrolase [Tomitella biformata]